MKIRCVKILALAALPGSGALATMFMRGLLQKRSASPIEEPLGNAAIKPG